MNGTYAFMADPCRVHAARISAATRKLARHGGQSLSVINKTVFMLGAPRYPRQACHSRAYVPRFPDGSRLTYLRRDSRRTSGKSRPNWKCQLTEGHFSEPGQQ